jgi:preprotein translocase subunit SecE
MTLTFFEDRTIDMAKTSPGEFIRQVRAEAGKIVWPTSRETVQTTILVLIMTTILALFFLGVDTVFNAIVSWLTSLAR